jgi:hypothetical protein
VRRNAKRKRCFFASQAIMHEMCSWKTASFLSKKYSKMFKRFCIIIVMRQVKIGNLIPDNKKVNVLF